MTVFTALDFPVSLDGQFTCEDNNESVCEFLTDRHKINKLCKPSSTYGF
jgi:hypothetical protein